jgi:hypothetical protein
MTALADQSRMQWRPSCTIDGQDDPVAKILDVGLLFGAVGPAHLVGRVESTIAHITPTGVPQ